MLDSRCFVALAGVAVGVGLLVCGVQADPPAREGGPPWLNKGGFRGGPPPWVVQRRGGGFEQKQARFSRMDTDGDGKISKEEVLAMHAKADTDGDGLVTREELSRHIMKVRGNAAGRHGPPAAETIFQNFDSNKDGKLSRDEVPAPVWSRLSSVDANDDGSVSKDEYQKAVESRRSGPTKATDAGQ